VAFFIGVPPAWRQGPRSGWLEASRLAARDARVIKEAGHKGPGAFWLSHRCPNGLIDALGALHSRFCNRQLGFLLSSGLGAGCSRLPALADAFQGSWSGGQWSGSGQGGKHRGLIATLSAITHL
jgi:hypothetical protein